MKTIGMWLAIFGGGSFLLNMIGYEFALIGWIDNWGPDVGMGIRIGMIVVGAVMFFLGMKQEQATE
ncbi:MAG: hypothetical protein AAFZ58_13840 [Pseudomonadota bacterium]